MKKVCCFTGTRDVTNFNKYELIAKLKTEIEKKIKDGYNYFIAGNAVGVDSIAAMIVIELKQKYPNISLEIAVPFKNHNDNILFIKEIQGRADYVNVISSSRNIIEAYFNRNCYMVDNSNALIGIPKYENGVMVKSGTKKTIDYAKQKNKEVIIINLNDKNYCPQESMKDFVDNLLKKYY